MKGLEPSTFAMARRRSSQLSYIRRAAPFYRRRARLSTRNEARPQGGALRRGETEAEGRRAD